MNIIEKKLYGFVSDYMDYLKQNNDNFKLNLYTSNDLEAMRDNAGGMAFLAHGYIYPFKDKDKSIASILENTEIDGMECVYSLFSEEEIDKAFALTEKYHKYRSGGSDYHGLNKPGINLGENKYRPLAKSLVNNWIDKCQLYK